MLPNHATMVIERPVQALSHALPPKRRVRWVWAGHRSDQSTNSVVRAKSNGDVDECSPAMWSS